MKKQQQLLGQASDRVIGPKKLSVWEPPYCTYRRTGTRTGTRTVVQLYSRTAVVLVQRTAELQP
jgi:hypothetical protein